MIKRRLEEVFKDKLFSGKALILLGARQVGKTTLLNDLVDGQAGLPLAEWRRIGCPENV